MPPITTRRELATLLERQMATASARPPSGQEDEVEGRTALKTYLLQAHGPLRTAPYEGLAQVAARIGFEALATKEPELIELRQDDLSCWVDVTDPSYFRLHTTATVKDADRVHEALIHASALLEPAWLMPDTLEALARRVEGSMVLFSLRHDRRPLRHDNDEGGSGVDLVTLRFWAPTAAETLARLRESEVLPGATSVNSVRVRVGNAEAYALTEAYHNGKFTSVGNSYAQFERLLRAVVSDNIAVAHALETSSLGAVRVVVPVEWTFSDPAYAVGKIFGGGEPFRLWGLPESTGDGEFTVRAIDLGLGKSALFTFGPSGMTIELPSGTPVGVAIRVVAALRYHVHADIRCDALATEPLLDGAPKAPATPAMAPLSERSELHRVARGALAEACGQWVRGGSTLTAPAIARALAAGGAATPALVELVRTAMNEAAAFEWREFLRPVISADRSTAWQWLADLPLAQTARARELVRLNRYAQRLISRLTGGVAEPWMQLSLFGAEALVPPAPADSPALVAGDACVSRAGDRVMTARPRGRRRTPNAEPLACLHRAAGDVRRRATPRTMGQMISRRRSRGDFSRHRAFAAAVLAGTTVAMHPRSQGRSPRLATPASQKGDPHGTTTRRKKGGIPCHRWLRAGRADRASSGDRRRRGADDAGFAGDGVGQRLE